MVATRQVDLAVGLTDDEIIAVAVRQERPWFGTLPTVDTNDEVQLLAAATRGTRSLAVRGLLIGEDGSSGDGRGIETVPYVSAVVGVEPAVVAYAARPADLFTPLATTVSCYQAEGAGEFVIDACLSSGIHDLVVRSAADAEGFVAGMVDGVVRNGIGAEEADDAVFVVLTSSSSGQRIAVIDAGLARIGDISRDGDTVGIEFVAEPAGLPSDFLSLG